MEQNRNVHIGFKKFWLPLNNNSKLKVTKNPFNFCNIKHTTNPESLIPIPSTKSVSQDAYNKRRTYFNTFSGNWEKHIINNIFLTTTAVTLQAHKHIHTVRKLSFGFSWILYLFFHTIPRYIFSPSNSFLYIMKEFHSLSLHYISVTFFFPSFASEWKTQGAFGMCVCVFVGVNTIPPKTYINKVARVTSSNKYPCDMWRLSNKKKTGRSESEV